MNKKKNSENFSFLLDEYFSKTKMKVDEIISVKVIGIEHNYVIVDSGLKSESYIPIKEFKNKCDELEVKIGDHVVVLIESIEDGLGNTILSRDKAKKLATWYNLENSMKINKTIEGEVVGKVKGGINLLIDDIRAFLPGSLIDYHTMKEPLNFDNKILNFKLIKLDRKRNNIIVSRKGIYFKYYSKINNSRDFFNNLKTGDNLKGIVKNITDYGVFVDLGPTDGLIHITDLAWRRINHPSQIVSTGDRIITKVLQYNKKIKRISLGLKQLKKNPWTGIAQRHPKGSRLFGIVKNITDYGIFVEIEKGIEGLVHISEMIWTNKSIIPNKITKVGAKVEVMFLFIDEVTRRISLSMKQCQKNPWKIFSKNHQVGKIINGVIKSITDFGIFVELPGNLDGLIHISNLFWRFNRKRIKEFKKGEVLKTIILSIDLNRNRVSLGLKQLNSYFFRSYIKKYKQGDIVYGIIKLIEKKNIIVILSKGVEGIINYNIKEKINFIKIGMILKLNILNINYKLSSIYLTKNIKNGFFFKNKLNKTCNIYFKN